MTHSRPGAIRAQIKAVADSVPAVGRFYSRQRFADNHERLQALYQPTPGGPIQGGFVDLVTDRETAPSIGRGTLLLRWALVHFRSIEDKDTEAEASEVLFDDMLHDVGEAFRANPTLNGTVDALQPSGTGQQAYVSTEARDDVRFAGVLCHRARQLLITVQFTAG